MEKPEVYALFWDHVEELRRTFIKILSIIALGIILSFCFYEQTILFITLPLHPPRLTPLVKEHLESIRISNTGKTVRSYTLPPEAILNMDVPKEIVGINERTYEIPPGKSFTYTNRIPETQILAVLGPLEGMFAVLKVSLWIGATITSPLWLLLLMQYIAPGLRKEEKRLIWPFILTSLGCMATGSAFALSAAIPFANAYLTAFNGAIGRNMWTLNNYLDYSLFLILANGLAFELFAIGIFAVRLEIIKAQRLVANRRLAAVGAFIIGALLTPPDIITQITLALPLIFLYEGLILYAKWREKRHYFSINASGS